MPSQTQALQRNNTKKAVAYLKTLLPDKLVNVTAIDPDTKVVTAITRHVDSEDIPNFIEQNNGKRNIYYSVNTPADDAPDNKLKKEHIKEINAVWIDADPVKCPEGADAKEHFAQERKRLHKFAADLAGSDNPPTVITDSGGGIQAFWWLDHPIPVTDDTRREYEAYSRGLADQYGTDRVQNIDRIMRLPYTWNIPGENKKGRERTLARSSKISDKRYLKLNFIMPSEAEEGANESDYGKLKIEDVKQPLQGDLLTKFEKLRKRNEKVDDLWTLRVDHKEGDRSDRDFTLAKELKGEGFSLNEAAIILWNYPHGKVQSVKYPVREIIRCYERSGNDFTAGMDEETVTRIANQTNPLLKERHKIQALIDGAAFIMGADATFQGSGVPLYKHFMNAETVNVLFGPSGSGKSFLTLDFAMHLATGKDWCGFKCKKKMAVLYICTESGSSFGKRAVAARSRVGIKPGASPSDFPFAYYPAHVDLLNNKDHLKLIANLIDDLEKKSGYKCGLVIVDTLSAAFGAGNENSEDMTKFVNNMAAIKYGKKTAVLVVHHTGKDESAGARGHSSLKGNIDTEIQVRSEKRGEKTYRSFSSTKQKDDETGNQKRFGLDIVKLAKDEEGDDITTCKVILEGETEFEAIAPSPFDDLSHHQVLAIEACYIFDRLEVNPDRLNAKGHISTKDGKAFTPKEIKALILNDLRENDQKKRMLVTGEKPNVGVLLEQLHVFAKPLERGIMKFLEDQRKNMEQKKVHALTEDFQLLEDYKEHMERAWNK